MWRNVEASLALTNLTDAAWREAQFAESTCVNQRNGLIFTSPASTGQPCPVQGSRPAQNAFADGIDGLSFTPGNPFGVRGGLQVFFRHAPSQMGTSPDIASRPPLCDLWG